MLWKIILVIMLLWFLGFVGRVGGGLIHLLLVAALVLLLVQLISGRRLTV